MYLKSLEIQGFKSFANKLVFEFKGGITGIVGPNGSGKSNVADAVRWVLGEQSAKQLRGAKMEDIIFSGTQTRKPLGFAYVAITLDNSDHKLAIDFDEVKVARRVYRSGESEYLINGANCRLKDVQELFLDTGIGKEGYSIIGQGQIDKILSGKPEDRRELFDEAAGIVKFKKRKLMAEKNLEEEKQNLCRINDILAEVEKQVEPLEKQSLVAKEYLSYREELKDLEINMFLKDYEKILAEQKQIDGKLEIAKRDLEDANFTFDQTKEKYEKLETTIEQFNTSLEEKKIGLNNYRLHKEKLEGDIKVYKEQMAASEQTKLHHEERILSIQKDLEEKTKELQKYDEDSSTIQEDLSAHNEKQRQIKSEITLLSDDIASTEKKIESCNHSLYEYMEFNANQRAEMQKCKTILEQNAIQKSALNQRMLKNRSNDSVLQLSREQKEKEYQEIEQKKLVLSDSCSNIQTKIKNLQQVIKDREQEYHEMQRQQMQEKSRLDSLKNMTERCEGYGISIRKIMERKQDTKGIEGVVADIIQVKKEYETAIEIALGGSIQNIVTDTELTAKTLIAYLKKNKFGRATFLPLTSVTGKAGVKDESVMREPGVIGLASSLVSCDTKYNKLIQYLLGRIIVVDTIDHAIDIAKKFHYAFRIVTLEGDLLSPGGSMSGGSYKNNSNLLSRHREIEKFQETIASLDKRMKECEEFLNDSKKESENYRTQFEADRTSLQQVSLSMNTIRMELQQIKDKQNEVRNLYEEIQKENTDIDVHASRIKEEIDRLKQLEDENQNKNKEMEDQISSLTVDLDDKRKQLRALENTLASVALDYSSVEQKLTYNKENRKRIENEIQKLDSERCEIEGKLKQAVSHMETRIELLNNTKEQIKEEEEVIATYNQELVTMEEKKEQLSTSHKSFLTKREELSVTVSHLDKETFRLNGQRDKLLEQLESKVTYMSQEYDMTYSMALEKKKDEYSDPVQMSRQIQKLKQQMKALGDVNVNAIEDYKNLLERYELLKTQHDDLIEAEEVLNKIIAELDEEMRKQFNEKFALIKEQFDVVFKELFGGGKGTLALMEDEDILEAGIKIIAQPPGKKLQNMMQLSGGEKALTAISLLFAIQNLKPSPFCLLDEIEAALDDANVKRYAKYLHKLTDHTQFIVITHRRGTMSSADTLYGVTMQEKGISTLVSVSLIEDSLDEVAATN